ncbi:MAG: hypothetical protein Q9188_004008 [Gyalolechia gomerana]
MLSNAKIIITDELKPRNGHNLFIFHIHAHALHFPSVPDSNHTGLFVIAESVVRATLTTPDRICLNHGLISKIRQGMRVPGDTRKSAVTVREFTHRVRFLSGISPGVGEEPREDGGHQRYAGADDAQRRLQLAPHDGVPHRVPHRVSWILYRELQNTRNAYTCNDTYTARQTKKPDKKAVALVRRLQEPSPKATRRTRLP